ncbi:MAG: AAA family ATPase, partial [Opitutales bacterium]
MIKKISKITNMGVFQDFDWNQTLRDRGNNVAQFLETNIIYGRNYSGKTTLSRVLRSLENKSLPDKYESPEFIVEGLDG